MEKKTIQLGDRVSEWGSYRCGTVINDTGDWVIVEYDYGRATRIGGKLDRKDVMPKDRLSLTTYYNECYNAWYMRDKLCIPTVAPQWLGK